MAAAKGPRPFNLALEETLSQLHLSFSLREEQKTALEAFASRKDVFAGLPMGYGKSIIYQLAPLVGKQMGLSAMNTSPCFLL